MRHDNVCDNKRFLIIAYILFLCDITKLQSLNLMFNESFEDKTAFKTDLKRKARNIINKWVNFNKSIQIIFYFSNFEVAVVLYTSIS